MTPDAKAAGFLSSDFPMCMAALFGAALNCARVLPPFTPFRARSFVTRHSRHADAANAGCEMTEGWKSVSKFVFAATAWALADMQASVAQQTLVLPPTTVTASRLQDGIRGTSTSIITAEEIARDPAATLQDILARQPGIQVQHLFGGVAGARDTVDMRGFGAAATANTLILLNGRRLNDVDLAGVDFSAIPRESIERIEIIRGNSAAVLYGDGAAGGAINIITKTEAIAKPYAKLDGSLGSYAYREGAVSAGGTADDTTFTTYANLINGDGYRENNELLQRNVTGEIRHKLANGNLFLNLAVDDQHLGLPGGRLVTATTNELETDRRGTSTPDDFADKQGFNATTGFTTALGDGASLIIDGGVRHKTQQTGSFSEFGSAFDSYFDTTLNTWSLTPRMNIDHAVAGLAAHSIVGIDFYYADYDSERALHRGDAPNHRYDLSQQTLSVYGQQTVALDDVTDLAFGARVQHVIVSASDRLDVNAPGGAGGVQGIPLDNDGQTQWAAHLGLEHQVNDAVTLFGRTGRSIRLPTVDERVGMSPFGAPTTFDLKTQTSYDVEAGVRGDTAGISYELSAYVMELKNELHFSPAIFTNLNLDPTRRTGIEASVGTRLTDSLSIKAGGAYTKAEFREGDNAGNEVPLVSRWTGNVALAWDILPRFLIADATVRYAGERRLDNDQANVQPIIPGYSVVDLRIGGAIEFLRWSLTLYNLFDTDYFDYGIASAFTLGTYNAYPQPGRTVLFKLGADF